jgi:hypothetical protein
VVGRVSPRVNTTIVRKSIRRSRLAVALAALCFFSTSRASAAERWATLESIHCVENPRDLTRPGPCGELGAYQFREMTWRAHTSEPFSAALDRRISDAVAVKHYESLKRGLERAGLPATSYNIALAWNSGLTAVVRGRAPAAARDYAERVVNLVGAFNRGALASAR